MGYIYNDVLDKNLQEAGFNTKHIKLQLDEFCQDITELAKKDKLDPVIGRDTEIDRVIQILGRRRKNNPCLVGYAGVGKTAIVEGLAQRIANGNVPRQLKDTKIYSLSLTTVVSNSKFRGQFEEKIQTLVEELKLNKHIILFIDEIHMLCSAGGSESMSATDILKPALARGEIRCIGATTFNEFKHSIEKDNALDRRFQKVTVNVPSVEDTIIILNNIKERYEQFHGVKYTSEIIKKIVKLTDNYITDRYFPDKAIDLLDEAGSYKKSVPANKNKQISAIEAKLEKNNALWKKAVDDNQYAQAITFNNICKSLKQKLESELRANINDGLKIITEDDLYEVLSKMTNVPLSKINDNEVNNLNGIFDFLKCKVIGQDEAINKTVKAIQRNRIGLKRKTGTMGNFIFVGPSSCGKTYLAKEIGEYLFGKESNILRIDMSEYAEPHSISKLIGAPPGYVGYGEGGILTEHVKENPRTVVVFDEAEKAHPMVFNILLQIMDEGFATDSMGRRVDFRNSLIIITSNLGMESISYNNTHKLGFGTKTNNEIEKKQDTNIVQKELQKFFTGEFLNRIDDIILFRSLSKDDMKVVLEKEIAELKENILEIGNYKITFTAKAKEYILNNGYDKEGGVRILQKTLKDCVENEICNKILEGTLKETIKVVIDEGKLKIK
ncbi:AAA family ATPase [uncultured Methanobrevibacter sp.]|uniref:AAA family ATPase n=1 Tax=uncultured Methanobrevibacter sp. TaxID=253161 RepID=UPI0025D0AAFA|nr:ATP-dependent Clp protease ATP-binding subunit [uncultured Methanobrevibacter sp.]